MTEQERSAASPDQRFVRKGQAAFLRAELVAKLESARQAEQPGDARSERGRQIAEKTLELFEASHDATGAWKGERFGQDLRKTFDTALEQKDAEGNFAITEELEHTQLLLVNMGELDRLNASGDHALGDNGLRLTAEKTEDQIRSALRERLQGTTPDEGELEKRISASYSIFRISGNDFAIKLTESDPAFAQSIQERIAGPMDVSSVRPGEEPVPLTVDRVSMADTLRVLNRLSPDDRSAFDGDDHRETIAVGAIRDLLQSKNDASKIRSRAARMLEKIREAKATGNDAAARTFYDKFQKKALGPLFKLPGIGEDASYDQLVAQAEGMGAFSADASRWTEHVDAQAVTESARQLKDRRGAARALDRTIAKLVAQETLEQEIELPERVSTPPPSETGGEQPFAPPEATRGKRDVLDKLEAEAKSLEAPCSANPEDVDACQQAEIARLDLEIESSERDALTGLEQRGRLFKSLEAGLESGKPVSMVFIDMAFLKYFDKEGGADTGNLAIKKTAEILDRVVQEFQAKGVALECYRLGGDEFSVSVQGQGPEVAEQVIKRLEQEQEAAGRVPAPEAPAGKYAPEKLSFNFGMYHAANKEELKARLAKANIPLEKTGTPDEANELADYLVRFADKELEIGKGINRLQLLMRRHREAQASGDRTRYDQLVKYSQKAIFGETGASRIAEWAAKPGGPELDREILEFVIENIDRQNSKKENYESSLDRLLEDEVRIQFFEKRIIELDKKIADLTEQLVQREGKIEHQGGELLALQQELETIRNLQRKIGG